MNHCAAYHRGNGGNAMDNSQNRKILAAYFSAQGATERAANRHSIFAGRLEENLCDLSGRVDGFVREAKEAAARPDDTRMEKLISSGREFNELADTSSAFRSPMSRGPR